MNQTKADELQERLDAVVLWCSVCNIAADAIAELRSLEAAPVTHDDISRCPKCDSSKTLMTDRGLK